MANFKRYMMVHKNPEIDCEEVQNKWRALARKEAGIWIRTYYSQEAGVRYCIWLAPGEEDLKNIFTEIGISWDSIVEVEEIVPDMWGEKWNEHLEEEAVADTLGN